MSKPFPWAILVIGAVALTFVFLLLAGTPAPENTGVYITSYSTQFRSGSITTTGTFVFFSGSSTYSSTYTSLTTGAITTTIPITTSATTSAATTSQSTTQTTTGTTTATSSFTSVFTTTSGTSTIVTSSTGTVTTTRLGGGGGFEDPVPREFDPNAAWIPGVPGSNSNIIIVAVAALLLYLYLRKKH